ncbi:HdeD family acid-resistance protein [Blastococcus sp. KM273129]|uniref:HdeD family acid-resistance protein n=1 Tax=Blastococcus sp. KM273129 TaxID=2570315 RepID=UPI001F34A32A|nr:DUF308 domain-containing protein [Blastococcus sp. KM273129]
MAGRLVLPSRSNTGLWARPRSVDVGAATGRHSQQHQRSARLDHHAATVLARGGLALLFALPTLLWPNPTVQGLTIAFALYAVLAAAGMVGTAVTDATDPHQPRGAYLVAGLVSALAGLTSLLWPQITELTLAMVIGAWAIAVGLLEMTAALAHLLEEPPARRKRRARTGEWLLAVAGITSIVVGIVVLLRPEASAAAQATELGVYALISAAVLLVAGWCLHADPSPRR